VREIRDRLMQTPRAANVFVQVTSRVFEIALDDGDIQVNPAVKIKPLEGGKSLQGLGYGGVRHV